MSELHELNSLEAALASFVEGPFGAQLVTGYQPLAAESLADPYRRLLVHHDHMTAVLYDYYGAPVELRVLQTTRQDNLYGRFILLTSAGSERVVETGVVQINLDLLSDPVRREILDARKPLGSILIDHDVMRRIEPKWYLRLQAGCPMVDRFGGRVREAYGRVGLIYCDHQPAIELLEVVADVKTESS